MAQQNVKHRAEFDFDCPAAQIEVFDSGALCNLIASGCNKEAMYIVVPLSPPRWGSICCPAGVCTVTLDSAIKEAKYHPLKPEIPSIDVGDLDHDVELGIDPSDPSVMETKARLIEVVKSETWSPGTTNEQAMDDMAPGGQWAAFYEISSALNVVYIQGDSIWRWIILVESEAVEFMEMGE